MRQLKRHNDRDWFREHKSEYQRWVEEPMKGLVLAVAAECRKRALPLHAKEKNPLFRIYRDIRFSKDKRPFKTHVAAELRRSFEGSGPMLYLHLSPEESFVAAGMWQPERNVLHAWRETIASEPARFQKILRALDKAGLALNKEYSLSATPRGFQNYANEPFAQWLKLTSFVLSRPLDQAECTRPDVLSTVVDFAIVVKPLLQFGWYIEENHLSDKRSANSFLD